MASASVKARNAAFVTLLVFGTHEEKVASEGTLFGVEMSTEEFHRAYQKEAEQLVANIQTRLSAYEIGYHEAWNAWLSHDPYKMAAECKKNQIRVLGHCTDILPKRSLLDPALILDVGICAEYGNGEKIWCHKRRNAQVVADNVYFGDSKSSDNKSGWTAPSAYGAPPADFPAEEQEEGELPF